MEVWITTRPVDGLWYKYLATADFEYRAIPERARDQRPNVLAYGRTEQAARDSLIKKYRKLMHEDQERYDKQQKRMSSGKAYLVEIQ